ncbi:MAG: hypothetical protein NTV86_09975 [Planctomycetota bacterium]|nr:hypothetical protein [Planctomycetota bacterium]
MTIIDARSLSAADIHHLGANLAAAVRRDRHDAHTTHAAAQSRPAEAAAVEAGRSPLTLNKKEPLRC